MFVLQHARRLHLRGYVKNQPDRSVLVLAQGPKASLERLLNLLWEGPFGAHVSHVEREWLESASEDLGAEFEVWG
jgi:acylphosphatase